MQWAGMPSARQGSRAVRAPARRCSCRSCIRRSTGAALRRLERGEIEVARGILELLAADLARAPTDQPFCPPGQLACVTLQLVGAGARSVP